MFKDNENNLQRFGQKKKLLKLNHNYFGIRLLLQRSKWHKKFKQKYYYYPMNCIHPQIIIM